MAHKPRYFWGDFGLWREGIVHVEGDDLAPQVHQGADQTSALVVPVGNAALTIQVECLGAPHPSSRTQPAWRSQYAAIRAGLRTRLFRSDPLVWVADDTTLDAVDSFSAPTITAAAHAFQNGDVVLVRRSGAGLYSIATVSNRATNTFDVTTVAGLTLHAIQAADQVYLVEAYWLPMIYAGLAPAPGESEGDWFARRLVYRFQGSGRYTYNRTAASGVGA